MFLYSVSLGFEVRNLAARNLKERIERGIARENELKIGGGNGDAQERGTVADLEGCVAA